MDVKNFFKIFSSGEQREPDPFIAENNRRFEKVTKNLPLKDYEFVVFDTELTGFDAKQNEIVAIGAVRIRNLQIRSNETFYALVKPEKHLYTRSTLVHRITPQELVKAESLSDVLPRFLEFCGDSFLVGHYVRLDLEFINRATREMMGGVLKTPYLDTLRLAMAYNELKHGHYYEHSNLHNAYTLAALAKEYNLPEFEMHNALQDALQTAYLFLFLVKKMKRHGLRIMDDYLKAGRKWKILL
ncbi:MAG: 3'-5' exonuclease [Desulfobulbaceae bacterium]|nr:3'-5' exonuclease [Desulfobulbaceae bacterium]